MPDLHRVLRAALTAALAASLSVAGTSGARAEPASTTVRGTVVLDGRPVSGVLVGTFDGAAVLEKGHTDAEGRFALRIPSSRPVEVFAGHNPRNAHAVFTAGEEHLVSAVIGSGAQAVAYEQVRSAAPSSLGGGGSLRFHLQRAGRFTASVPTGGTGAIALAREATGPRWTADGDATTSDWLVPGAYDLRWEGDARHLDGASRVRVLPGTTTRIAPPVLRRGTTVRIRATSGGAAVPANVGAADETGLVHRTDADGTLVVEGVAPGRHTYAFDGDGYLPATVAVTATKGQEEATAVVALTPAARITGSVPVRTARTIRVVAQDGDGDVVSAQENDGSGSFTLSGLPAGTFTVVAEDLQRHVYDRLLVTTEAGSTTAAPRPLAPAIPDLTVSGRIEGGRKAHVALVAGHGEQVASTSTGAYAASYRLRVPPGRYTPRTWADRREAVDGAVLRLTASTTQDLRVGHRTSSAAAVFRVHGHRVRPSARAVSADGTLIRFDTAGRAGATVTDLAPQGRYTWVRGGAPLAVDGPWTFAPPTGSFRVGADRTTDLGTVPVSIVD